VIRRVPGLRSLEFDAKAKAAATYNAAADRYDDPLNSFWARFGIARSIASTCNPDSGFLMFAAAAERPLFRQQKKWDLTDLFSESISRKSYSL
jgi:hypothetical protein